MYSFPISLLPFLVVINLFDDVIISYINGYICPNANVTVHIQATGRPYWRMRHYGLSCQTCDPYDYFQRLDIHQFTFYSNNGQDITNIEMIQFVHPNFVPASLCRSADLDDSFFVLGHMELVFQMSSAHSVTDQLAGINVPLAWNMSLLNRPQISIQKSKLHLNIEQNISYPYKVESPDRVKCTSNLTYNITVKHDCPPQDTTEFITTIFASMSTDAQTAVNANTVKTNEEPTKAKFTLPTVIRPKSHPELKKDNQENVVQYVMFAIGYTIATVITIIQCIMCYRMYKRSKKVPWFKVDRKELVAKIDNLVVEAQIPTQLNANFQGPDNDQVDLPEASKSCSVSESHDTSKTVQTASKESKAFVVNLESTASKTNIG